MSSPYSEGVFFLSSKLQRWAAPKPIPAGPAGWGTYGYASTTSGTFTISNSGDGTSVSLP